MKPQNLEEKVVWYSLVGIYVFYFLGAQYVFMPLIAWFLVFYLGKKLWSQTENTPPDEKVTIPFTVWVWIVSMLVMEVALIIGHIDFNLGLAKIITSSINWARSWALMALYPLIGCLNIRPKLIYRAVCIICLQSLIFIPICYLAYTLRLPDLLYDSPLRLIGGNGELFYQVRLYGFEQETNQVRLSLFAPWAPGLGMVANIYFLLACQESNKKWRLIGMIASIAMILGSFSRLSLLCIVIVPLITLLLVNLARPGVQFAAGILSVFAGIFAPLIIGVLETFQEQFSKARASSSRVRETLARIALDRWSEAPIWGHGIIEPRGPRVVAFMPIGTHHTWFGILFEKGIVGLIALAFPLLWSFFDLLSKTYKNETAKTGLSILLVIFLFTFGEKIEGLSYIYWPGLVLMGIALKERV
ncbi:O-antigen ligase family protein [Chlorogloeopsis sp. ULAP01]|uniref:O-antigen ligase family protein n=1 Tax=Chlorogloeopsis sp. ULAP01 TaxID=3056483 RepID=UPI0025AA4706|nr:O-antigen ligase family protein [Chlorogloeopsis sp. ULAP01]MDM9379592.1 O-antigen ligase family protein [Chlorogloeopsis sp. ULAP01]